MVASPKVVRYSGDAAPEQALTDCLSQAFAGYNGWAWMMGDSAGAECSSWLIARQTRAILDTPNAVVFAVHADDDPSGVVAAAFLIRCPSSAPPPPHTLLEKARLLWNLGPRIALRGSSFGATVAQLQEHDASGEHFKVSFVGVVPHMQGKGLASQVLRAMLDTVDSEDLPCYLFTANDRNEALYSKYLTRPKQINLFFCLLISVIWSASHGVTWNQRMITLYFWVRTGQRYGFVTRSRRPMGAIASGPLAGEEMVLRSMLRPATGVKVRDGEQS